MRVRSAAVVPLLLLALAGCSSDPDVGAQPLPPAPSPTTAPPAPSPSPTGSPSPAPDSPQAAAAAASQFYVELGKAFTTLDSTPIRALSSPTCVDCKDTVASIDREKAAGHQWSGGEITIFGAEASKDSPTQAVVAISYESAPLRQLDASPAASPSGPVKAALEVKVVRGSQGWLVDGITKVG